jgi:hypothetical protein
VACSGVFPRHSSPRSVANFGFGRIICGWRRGTRDGCSVSLPTSFFA